MIYRNLYNLREKIASKIDVNRQKVCTDVEILVIAREKKKPDSAESFLQCLDKMSIESKPTLKCFATLFGAQIAYSLHLIPKEKDQIFLENKERKNAPNPVNSAIEIKNKKRRIAKVNRANSTLSKIKYDDSMVVDKDGEFLFICDEKKANWYLKDANVQVE